MLYLKLLEEKELTERFGEAYLAYKREVPFIIPRLPGEEVSGTASEAPRTLPANLGIASPLAVAPGSATT
ncbi:MAG: hypothetical protein MZU91_01865 [Desulfosudis oleivorans]|nr:hypothetical protein [Desulfosudis oleivorans]